MRGVRYMTADGLEETCLSLQQRGLQGYSQLPHKTTRSMLGKRLESSHRMGDLEQS